MNLTYVIKLSTKDEIDEIKAVWGRHPLIRMLADLYYTGMERQVTLDSEHVYDALDNLLAQYGPSITITEVDAVGIQRITSTGEKSNYLPLDFDSSTCEVKFDVELSICAPSMLSNGNPTLRVMSNNVVMYELDYLLNCDDDECDVTAEKFITRLGTANYHRFFPVSTRKPAETHADDDYPIDEHDTYFVHPPIPRKQQEHCKLEERPVERKERQEPKYKVKGLALNPYVVYRAAAMAVASLDLVGIIKSERAINDNDQNWKEMTSVKLLSAIMSATMLECDRIVETLLAGKLDSLLGTIHYFESSTLPLVYSILKFGNDEYSFNIFYLPITANGCISLEVGAPSAEDKDDDRR